MKEKKQLPLLKEVELKRTDDEATRCTGHCCRRFTMRYSPEEMWAKFDDWKEHSSGGFRPAINDIHIIAPMLRYLGTSRYDVNGRTSPVALHFYTCKHFDSDAGNCTIYEHRPAMCREYPYGNTCRYLDCTMHDPANFTEGVDRKIMLREVECELRGEDPYAEEKKRLKDLDNLSAALKQEEHDIIPCEAKEEKRDSSDTRYRHAPVDEDNEAC